MEFVETSVFTRRIAALAADEEYRLLQCLLANRPESGGVILGSGGIRKIRCPGRGRGKRGGLRVLYYWIVADDRMLMLYVFAKNERADLTPAQLKVLRRVVEEELR